MPGLGCSRPTLLLWVFQLLNPVVVVVVEMRVVLPKVFRDAKSKRDIRKQGSGEGSLVTSRNV
jgi:hypothetical protein